MPKPATELTDDELHAEWEAGMYFDAAVGLTEAQEQRLEEIEREQRRREDARVGAAAGNL